MGKSGSFYLYLFSGRSTSPRGFSFVAAMCRDAAGLYETGFAGLRKNNAPDSRADYVDWDIDCGSYNWVEVADDWSWVRSVSLNRKADTPALASAFKKLKSNTDGNFHYRADYEVQTNDGENVVIRGSDIEEQIGLKFAG